MLQGSNPIRSLHWYEPLLLNIFFHFLRLVSISPWWRHWAWMILVVFSTQSIKTSHCQNQQHIITTRIIDVPNNHHESWAYASPRHLVPITLTNNIRIPNTWRCNTMFRVWDRRLLRRCRMQSTGIAYDICILLRCDDMKNNEWMAFSRM